MSLLTGEADISSMIKLLPKLIEQGDYKNLLTKMVTGYMSSHPLGSMVSSYLGNVLDSAEGEKFLNGVYAALEEFVKSKSYDRIVEIVPKLMAAKNSEETLNVIDLISSGF